MDVRASGTDDGTQVQEWSCNGTSAQSFELQDAGNGAFYIVSTNANKCVDVAARGTTNGTKIQIYDCNQTPAQSFYVEDAGSGFVRFVNTNSGKCLDVAGDDPADGTVVQLYDCNGTNAQTWNPTGSGGSTTTPPSGGSGVVSTPPANATQFFVHYMAWFQGKPVSSTWGWHWTMNAENPDLVVNGQRQIASQLYPSIGPYDSSDPDLLEYHVLLMKYSGIRGAFVDWYGIDDPSNLDYGMQTRNTGLLFTALKRAGLQLGIVYEDQSIGNEINLGDLAAGNAMSDGQSVMQWLHANWFADPSYATWNGEPILLNFGPQYFTSSAEWSQLFSVIPSPPSLFTLHSTLSPAATGCFYWPEPSRGTDGDRAEYLTELPHITIPAAYPRFADFYAQAGVGPSYGSIADDGGATYTDRLSIAMTNDPKIVQLVTWNDWGEGTTIEPSVQYGTRDLEATQRAVASSGWTDFPWTAADLQLPQRLYDGRKASPGSTVLDQVSDALMAGNPSQAATLLSSAGL